MQTGKKYFLWEYLGWFHSATAVNTVFGAPDPDPDMDLWSGIPYIIVYLETYIWTLDVSDIIFSGAVK